ncbi:MAG: fatty acid desaturase family protein [Microcoleaceae cyanobacterium]
MTQKLTAPNLSTLDDFVKDLEEIKKEAYASISSEDFYHLRRTEIYGHLAALLGYATAWIAPNPISIIGISLAQFTRWLLAHHILHKGYDKVPNIPDRYTSRHFARGMRRFIDWFDWLHPDAWDYEHNTLHHYYTGEDTDPDLVERNVQPMMASLPIPRWLKYVVVILLSLTWKYTYYAPSTISTLKPHSVKRLPVGQINFLSLQDCFSLGSAHARRLWLECYLPYAVVHFCLIPLLFWPLGWWAVISVLINKILAECLTNLHAYIVVLPNHTADDIYRFDFHYQGKGQFYITQILGSVNYDCGDELTDYLHLYLNYQIEHHLIPDLPMSGYRRIQPQVKALCERYGIPYRQQNVFLRVKKMLDICVGTTHMTRAATFSEVECRLTH